jgi:hypothetical protein
VSGDFFEVMDGMGWVGLDGEKTGLVLVEACREQ